MLPSIAMLSATVASARQVAQAGLEWGLSGVREDVGLRKELAQAIVCHDQPSRRRDTMAITLHHLIIPARNKRASAQLFAEIFGLTVKPSEGRFAQVPLDEHLTIDFADDEHTRGILHFVPDQLESHHYAFHVTDEEFDGIFGRVKAKGLAYGSGPTTEADGEVADRREVGRGPVRGETR